MHDWKIKRKTKRDRERENKEKETEQEKTRKWNRESENKNSLKYVASDERTSSKHKKLHKKGVGKRGEEGDNGANLQQKRKPSGQQI